LYLIGSGKGGKNELMSPFLPKKLAYAGILIEGFRERAYEPESSTKPLAKQVP